MPRELSEEAFRILHKSPAVKNVTEPGCIYHTTEFRDHFLKEYAKCHKTTKIFRDVGLTPELIGRKRIERSTARWLERAKKQKEQH